MVLLDNIGLLMASLFKPVNSASLSVSGFIEETTGNNLTIGIYGAVTSNSVFNATSGSNDQIGKGSSTPTRQDFKIESPFVASPENLPFTANAGGYNSGQGKISIPALLSPTGGSGAITEVIKEVSWRDNLAVIKKLLIIRDVITPVNFISGKNINVEHEVFI